MEYERREFTEWYDQQGGVIKQRLRHDRFYLSAWELNKLCDSLVRISDGAAKALVASSQRNHYLLK